MMPFVFSAKTEFYRWSSRVARFLSLVIQGCQLGFFICKNGKIGYFCGSLAFSFKSCHGAKFGLGARQYFSEPDDFPWSQISGIWLRWSQLGNTGLGIFAAYWHFILNQQVTRPSDGYSDLQMDLHGFHNVSGYTGLHRATMGYTGVLRATQGVHRATQGYAGVIRGTQGYTGVHRGTHLSFALRI